MASSDKELIEQYVSGDERAFGALVEFHIKSVYNYVYRLCKDKNDVEDIVQEVFLKVWKNIRKYNHEQNFKTWFFAIARNTTIDWLRKRKHIPFSYFENQAGKNDFAEDIVDTEPLADEVFAQIEDVQMLEKLLDTLSPHEREILTLRYTDDLTFDEIGKILKQPLNTVKSIHRRTIEKLGRIKLNSKL